MALSKKITIIVAIAVPAICILILASILTFLNCSRNAKASDAESGPGDAPANAVPLQNVVGILGDAKIAKAYLDERRVTAGSHRSSWCAPYEVSLDPKRDDNRVLAVILPSGLSDAEREKLKDGWPRRKVYTDDRKGTELGLPEDIMVNIPL